MSAIGGYFELELPQMQEFHSKAIRLNSGRNCLKYLLENRKYKKIYVPAYVCDVVVDVLKELNVEFEFYRLTKDFKPVLKSSPASDEALLYVNYFGVNSRTVNELTAVYPSLIIDNSQAFFEQPVSGLASFYSPRKFFGVADGGYLYADKLTQPTSMDKSVKRYAHLLTRIEEGAQDGYKFYLQNEEEIGTLPIAQMSNLTRRHLTSIDYDSVREARNRNFRLLHEQLGAYNEISIDLNNVNGPLVYPLLINSEGIKQKLIADNIFVATYWPGITEWLDKDCVFEQHLIDHLLPLPVDQRYSEKDMNFLLKQLKALL